MSIGEKIMTKSARHTASSSASTLAPGSVASLEQVPRERSHFRALLVGNPNYFGNLASSPFPPVLSVKGSTTYEKIKCVGFNPQLDRLDAVVFLNQSFGYGGGICTAGSPEFVRFYLSFDNGGTWIDQGVTSFTVYDVPADTTAGHHLEYAASVPSTPPRKWCTIPNVILARAILSWHDMPPPNTPDHTPVWGNVHDTHIQVDPIWFLKWVDLLKLSDIKLTPVLADSLDLDQTVSATPKKALEIAELKELYQSQGVEPHRYAMAEIKKLIKTPELTVGQQHPFYSISAKQLGFALSDVIDKLLATDGSTVYEELDCVGLRPNGLSNELVGVLRIKRSSGFSGGPCTQGSREYVTFWGDFNNNGTFETCLGTASVQVFDLPVPKDGLEYSIRLPVNLNPYRRQCGEGPRVVPIRAILSWNEVPDCGNPNWVPTWGNREETLILIPPGLPIVAGDYSPFLHEVSGQHVCSIHQSAGPDDGLANGVHPFGGELCITGAIPGALDLATPDTLEYKVWATQGATTLPLVTPFWITVNQGAGPGLEISYSIHQSATAEYFVYREYGTPALGAYRQVSSPERLLARWNTTGLTGTWTIHIQARVVGTVAPIYAAGTTFCLADGTIRTDVKVTLDQDPPVPNVSITGYTDTSGFHAAVPCGDFTKGVTINGTFDITDNIGIGPYSLILEPNLDPPDTPVSVIVVVNAGSTATHQFGTWSVATATLPPCGYVVRLDAYDRTIANCGSVWHDKDTVGFCLRSPA
jgi:hypothetical protein